MKIQVEETKRLKQGNYTATITRIEYPDKSSRGGYAYADIYMAMDSPEGIEMRMGVPLKLKRESQLGKIIELYSPLVVGSDVDPEEVLKGKRCRVFVRETKEGFNDIDPESFEKVE